MRKYKYLVIWVAVAAVITATLMWVTMVFHPYGFLGTVERSFRWLLIVPYVVGVMFGNNVHDPNMFVLIISLFVEILLIVLTVLHIALRLKK